MNEKDLKYQFSNIETLVPYARNARVHTDQHVAQIAASIREFGFNVPILIDEKNNVIAGHGRLLAARKLGLDSVPVLVASHLTDTQRRAFILADNKIHDNSVFDFEALNLEIEELAAQGVNLSVAGFIDMDIPSIDMSIGEGFPESTGEGYTREGLTEPEYVPEVGSKAVSRSGDVWVLGNHRLMCGDSSDRDYVGRLMNGGKADMVFTDPPYNVGSENKGIAQSVSKSHEMLMGCDWDKHFDFATVSHCILESIAENATVYICTSHHLACSIWEWMKGWASHHSWCTWSKPNPMPSLMKRHWTWNAELICYATRGKHTFNFPEEGHALSTWTLNKVNGKSGHPTEKPVTVPEHAIIHSSKPDDVILDLFGGSGSTLIACEKNGRKARLMELDPLYCDLIVKRWEAFTGGNAILDGSGESFDMVKELRGI